MQSPHSFDKTAIATFQFPGRVNRKRVIATCEDKANITGYRWTRPKKFAKGFVERYNAKGEFLDYTVTLPFTIQDVDGREKHTTRTTFFDTEKQPKDEPAPFIGEWIDGLARTYHGTLHVYRSCRTCGTRATSPVKRTSIPLRKWQELLIASGHIAEVRNG